MSIDNQVKKGVKWTSISTIFLTLIALGKIAILSRFLEKSDFGIMALITFVMAFIELFNNMGMTTAILSKNNISKKQYDSLYWFNWMISIIMYIILISISPLVASFYQEPDLVYLIPIVGVNLLTSAIGKQFKTIEQKNLKFSSISAIEMITAFLSIILSTILAYQGYGVYSLVYSLILQITLSNILFFIIGKRKYGLSFFYRFSEVKPFLRIGLYQVGAQFINYFNRDMDILIVGKLLGTEVLGGYSLARDLVRKPSAVIDPIVSRVGAPALSSLSDDKNRLKESYLNMTKILSSITIPLYIGIILFAYPIVVILYGEKFLNIVILVQILSINMIFRTIGGNVGNLVIATGRTDLDFKWNVLTLFVTPLFVYLGAFYGVIGVAGMLSFSMVILFYPSYCFFIKRMLPSVSWKEYFRSCFSVSMPMSFIKKS